MIVLSKLTVNNFMSIGSISLNIRDGIFLVEGKNRDEEGVSSNGTGKSSLFEAITWCLYGNTVRGVAIDQVVRRKSKGTHVSVGLIIHGKGRATYMEVHRYRKDPEHGDGVRLLVDGKEQTPKKVAEANKAIVEQIGIDFDTMRDALYLTQGFDNRFSEKTPTQRLLCLERIVDTQIYEVAAKKARERVRGEKSDIQEKSAVLKQMMARLEELGEIENGLREDIARLSQPEEVDLDGMRKRLAELDVESLAAEISSLEAALDELQKEEGEKREERRPLDSRSSVLVSTIGSLRDNLGSIKKLKQCPTCDQEVPPKHRSVLVSRIVSDLSEKEKELTEVSGKCESLDKALERMSANMAEKKSRIRELRKQKDVVVGEKAELEQQIAEISQAEESIASLQRQVEDIDARATTIGDKYREIKDAVKSTKEELSYDEFWESGFQELRRKVLEGLISFLNTRIAEYSRFLWERSVSLVLDDKNIKLELDGYDIKGCSGGECKRVDLAVAFALRDLVAAGMLPCSWLIVDEPFDFLDGSGAKGLVTLLSNMNVPSVFVITHDESIKALIPDTIILEKCNGVTALIS